VAITLGYAIKPLILLEATTRIELVYTVLQF